MSAQLAISMILILTVFLYDFMRKFREVEFLIFE